jgi:hypothetical protein
MGALRAGDRCARRSSSPRAARPFPSAVPRFSFSRILSIDENLRDLRKRVVDDPDGDRSGSLGTQRIDESLRFSLLRDGTWTAQRAATTRRSFLS